MPQPVSLSTDQLAALIEVARQGSLRGASAALFITEQGVRNRLIALEQELGIELYRKARGVRHGDILTSAGRTLLPQALRLVEQTGALRDLIHQHASRREIHIASSQYLSAYVLIDAIRRFHKTDPHTRVWLSVRTERDIEQTLLNNPDVAFGVAAPYEPSPDLIYEHLFAMAWSVITPPRHALSKRKSVALDDLQNEPLILFERGSTGRQHVMEAFAQKGLTPRVEMEATSTDLVVRMVAAGLGVAIIPLLPSGAVTKGHAVAVRDLSDKIRPIDSGLLFRRGDELSEASRSFISFIRNEIKGS